MASTTIRELAAVRGGRWHRPITAALAAALVSWSALGLGPARATSAERPLIGSFATVTSVPGQGPADCLVHLETAQQGQATHVGLFTGTGRTCGFNAAVTENPPFNLAGGAPPFFVADFTVEQTWIAPNGDTLTWESPDGVFVQSLTDGTSSAMGSMVITGGTGRFAGASGQGQVVSNSTVVPDTSFIGSITYDAAR